jgi:glucose-1-phosphate cytidylyltransferase
MGTRLSEETEIKPKPMVEIGGRPILWHIMKIFAHHGLREFLIALGYKGEAIKRFFLDYHTLNGSMSVNLSTGAIESREKGCEDWLIHLIETGDQSQTGGRIKRLESYVEGDTFMVTYGDGVADVNIKELLAFHRSHGRRATITAVHPPARYGELIFERDMIARFTEKPQTGEGWISGGFLVFEPEVLKYLKDDNSVLEKDALERLAAEGQLVAYKHNGFWQCMDTLRDKRQLEAAWATGNPPWKVWE